ncbi:MAG: bifunctional 4-hydroxy-2-oxoglutarate aldolase/2-dehydro-3-deoxy-phosphogluconate aldolase [Opitutaceae bacterium]
MDTSKLTNATETIERSGVVCITRMDDQELILNICDALYSGGVRCFEIPLTTHHAPEIIAKLQTRLNGDSAVGAGTVLTAEAAEAVIDAGAGFVVSPHFEPEVAVACQARSVAFIPGAFTPAEIFRAWSAGADIVKVFPIRPLGPSYLSDVLGPYPGLKLMPTGGITLDNASSFIKAGACAVTVGRDLIGGGPWNAEAFAGITQRARNLITKISSARLG